MKIKIVLTILLAMMVLAAACRTQPAQPTLPTQPATGTGGELVRLGSEPPTLDPHLTGDADSAVIVVEVFGGLVTLDPDFNVVPDLAEAMPTISADRKTYTFTLRRDARFHSGRAVTANDVKWSLERAADPRTLSTTVDTYLGDIVGVREKLSGRATEISGVKVIDERTIEITIDAPKTYFLAKLTYPTAFVLDRANVESSAEWFKKPSGTGPFKLKQYIPGELIVLERFADYHLGSAKLNTVRFLLAGGTPMVMYENNEIHITGVGLADLDRVRDPNSPLNKELRIAPAGFQTSYIGLNVDRPPFDDVKVRLALNYAINKEQIADQVLANLVKPAYSILPPGFPGYSTEVQGPKYDPEKARQLLAESKYGADLSKLPRMTLTVPGALGTAVGLDLEAIMAMWRENLGIEVDVQQVEFATFLRDLDARRLQMYAIAWIADYPDPQNFIGLLFHSESVNNQTGYSNPEVDRLVETAGIEPDENNRFALYRQAEQIILDDAPWVTLWHSGEGYVLVKPEVKGYLSLPLIVPKYRFVSLEK
ncbi:MAG: peptide ABC transporter substrate-binding protein [Chloroflexi bacterium]|nr:peptide ABC transporter substrate-binding protein [Chloroflexota bacterium]